MKKVRILFKSKLMAENEQPGIVAWEGVNGWDLNEIDTVPTYFFRPNRNPTTNEFSRYSVYFEERNLDKYSFEGKFPKGSWEAVSHREDVQNFAKELYKKYLEKDGGQRIEEETELSIKREKETKPENYTHCITVIDHKNRVVTQWFGFSWNSRQVEKKIYPSAGTYDFDAKRYFPTRLIYTVKKGNIWEADQPPEEFVREVDKIFKFSTDKNLNKPRLS